MCCEVRSGSSNSYKIVDSSKMPININLNKTILTLTLAYSYRTLAMKQNQITWEQMESLFLFFYTALYTEIN